MPVNLFGDWGFVAGSDATTNPYQDAQQCINYYPELSPSKTAKEVASLLGSPGLVQVGAVPGGGAPGFSSTMSAWPQPSSVTNLPVRGSWVLPGRTKALVVVANTCYLATPITMGNLTVAGSIALLALGKLNTTSGPVCIRDDGVGGYAVIVDGTYGYTWNASTNAFAMITDPNFTGSPQTVAFIDGWWIFNQRGTPVFYTNVPQYGITFQGSYYALKDAFSDNLMGVIENKEELWLIGETTTEIWYDAGGAYFPFQRLVGTPIQYGCCATYSIARLVQGGQESLMWLARSERGENVVVRTTGFTAQVVSTPAVSNAIAQYTTTSDAIAYTYEEGAHEFFVLIFPTADATWVYDATVPPDMAWTQRLSYDPYADQYHRHRSNCFMNFAGMRVVGDYQNGALYQLTRNAYTDAGWPIKARRRSPYIWNKENRERVFMASLQVDFAPGQGNASGMGSNPQAHLRISRDYGTTYGPDNPSPIGQIGAYTNRCMWRKLGFSRGAVAQIEVIDPVNRDIVGATLRAVGP
jgi:hypothetical protein